MRHLGLVLAVGLAATGAIRAETAALSPAKDNTIFDFDGMTSNGIGEHLFSGRNLGGSLRRALVQFDLASAIPAGSTVTSVTLRLRCTRATSGTRSMTLHRVLTDWGEGTSDSGQDGGTGSEATIGDATWTHAQWPGTLWTTVGGDFAATASASQSVSGTGYYTWGSTAGLIADVQAWVDLPSSNFGWLVRGVESVNQTAKRFSSRENSTTANRPLLTVQYTPPPPSPGAVPDGADVPGAPLLVDRLPGGDLELSWGPSCLAEGSDFAVYEGEIGAFASHAPITCSTGGLTQATFAPSLLDAYYLVVPRNASFEGSYGYSSAGADRPVGTSSCLPQSLGACP